MTWARLDDGFWRNEKVAICSDAALGLYARAISYCADQRTDGRISKAAAGLIKAKPHRLIELVTIGLFEDNGDGSYRIHDFLQYNPSAAELDSRSHSKAIAGAKGAASRWHNTPDGPVPSRPVPVPVPVPGPTQPERARCYRAYENMAGSLTKTIIDRIDGWVETRHDVDEAAVWVETACGIAAEQEKRNWAYVAAILKRWEHDGFQADTRPRNGEVPQDASRGVNTGGGLVVKTLMQEAREASERERAAR